MCCSVYYARTYTQGLLLCVANIHTHTQTLTGCFAVCDIQTQGLLSIFVVVCCIVFQCVAAHGSVLQSHTLTHTHKGCYQYSLQCVAGSCSVLQCVSHT